MSDFKSNEYANLVGGPSYEPHEENPMIGYRGASRYLSPDFADCFAMEAEALRYVRDDDGPDQRQGDDPVRPHPDRGRAASSSCWPSTASTRGENGLQVIMMCELPSNAVIADQFLEHFDGFSIGSNDMTQLTLGLDRDSGAGRGRVRRARPRGEAHARAGHRGLQDSRASTSASAGRGPSDHPDLAAWLLDQHIDTMSLNPDTVVDTWMALSKR